MLLAFEIPCRLSRIKLMDHWYAWIRVGVVRTKQLMGYFAGENEAYRGISSQGDEEKEKGCGSVSQV